MSPNQSEQAIIANVLSLSQRLDQTSVLLEILTAQVQREQRGIRDLRSALADWGEQHQEHQSPAGDLGPDLLEG